MLAVAAWMVKYRRSKAAELGIKNLSFRLFKKPEKSANVRLTGTADNQNMLQIPTHSKCWFLLTVMLPYHAVLEIVDLVQKAMTNKSLSIVGGCSGKTMNRRGRRTERFSFPLRPFSIQWGLIWFCFFCKVFCKLVLGLRKWRWRLSSGQKSRASAGCIDTTKNASMRTESILHQSINQ